MVHGIHEVLGPESAKIPIVYLDGDGQYEASWAVAHKHLRASKGRRALVGAMNDNSALGVLRAFEEVGSLSDCAVMGQNGSPEARQELRRRGTHLIGSVAYFPETYGEELVRLALDILYRRFVPPAVFTRHQLLTPKNVDHAYANDALMSFPPASARGSLQDIGVSQGKPQSAECVTSGGGYDLMGGGGVSLQAEHREEAPLQRRHAGETDGGGKLPLALAARVDDRGFTDPG